LAVSNGNEAKSAKQAAVPAVKSFTGTGSFSKAWVKVASEEGILEIYSWNSVEWNVAWKDLKIIQKISKKYCLKIKMY